MTSIADERKSAEIARGIVSSLTPSTLRTDAMVVALRLAASTASGAIKNLSSQTALDEARGEAATALNGAAGLLHRRALMQEMIDRARTAVEAWLSGLDTPGD
jgi:hypothetical protein